MHIFQLTDQHLILPLHDTPWPRQVSLYIYNLLLLFIFIDILLLLLFIIIFRNSILHSQSYTPILNIRSQFQYAHLDLHINIKTL